MELGFSVYLGEPFDEDYIETMLDQGCRYIFTSLQIPEEDEKVYLTRLAQLAQINAHRARIIADVNTDTLARLDLSLEDPQGIEDAGIDIVRLDEGAELDVLAEYVEQKHAVMLNASTDAFRILRALSDRAISQENILVAHNYYPRHETGLDRSFFQHINERLKGAFPEIQIMAFVQGTKLRGPIYRGLPTLEAHRNMHPLAAASELESDLCDIACIGDSQIDAFLIKQFNHYVKQRKVLLRTDLNQESPYLGTYHNRLDVARDVVRAEEARRQFKDEVIPQNAVERPTGTITLDNHLYGRYMNELQITRTDLPADAAVNVLGHIEPKDIDCLNLIASGTAFQLIGREEEDHGL